MRGFAAIKLCRAVLRDAFERCGKLRLLQPFAGLEVLAAMQKNLFACGECLQARAFFFQFGGKFLAEHETFFRQADGRRHNVRKLHRAIGFQS